MLRRRTRALAGVATIAIGTIAVAACDPGRALAPEFAWPSVPLLAQDAAPAAQGGGTPFSLYYLNRCAGDVFLASGRYNTSITREVDASGGVHIRVHVNFQGVSGESQITGTKYQLVSNQLLELNADGPPPVERTTFVQFRIIGQGPDNDLIMRTMSHVTVNANGDITVLFRDGEVECR